ncbi:MAG TPA: SHOCT domain-containing protein [Ktedonobacterales bacterium]|nr:SHOCT domain-containing protein [Ktedonobacterales bacterium]
MPGREFGPGYAGPGHMWIGLVFMGLSLLFWLGIPALLAWAALRWVAPRWRGLAGMSAMSGGMMQTAQPSAIETLRHRYALGEIDSTTFEQMVERILASEARERQGEQPIAPLEPDVYNT